jgi:hypothetical protein
MLIAIISWGGSVFPYFSLGATSAIDLTMVCLAAFEGKPFELVGAFFRAF